MFMFIVMFMLHMIINIIMIMDMDVDVNIDIVYRRELNLAISSSPVTKTMYICLVRRTAICVEKENF